MRAHKLFMHIISLVVIVCAQSIWAHARDESEDKQVDWPDTYAARWGKAFFEAYNKGEKDALRRFVREHYSDEYLRKTPIEEELNKHLQLKRLAGKLTVHTVSADDDFAVDIVACSELLGWMKFQFKLSPKPLHDPVSISGGPTSPPEAVEIENYDDWKELSHLLEKIRSESGAPGMAASIVHKGKIIDKAVTGFRRFDRTDRIQIDDRFHIGSVGKVFTGTMVGKLLKEEALRWDMTIGEVLKDIPMREEYRGVTLEQLLGHRGGIRSLPEKGEFADGFPRKPGRSSAEARAALVKQVLNEDSVKPGEYSYSNAGYVVAGYMVERTMQRTWEELVSTLVFKPLGLRSTGFGWPATTARTDQPRGHYGAPPEFKVQEIGEYMLGDMDYIGPAGNLHCSIEDLARFSAFHIRVLNEQEDSLKAETVPRIWRGDRTVEGERRFCFFGSGGTFFAMVALYPDSDLAVVAATNCGLHAWPFMEKLRDAVYERMKREG